MKKDDNICVSALLLIDLYGRLLAVLEFSPCCVLAHVSLTLVEHVVEVEYVNLLLSLLVDLEAFRLGNIVFTAIIAHQRDRRLLHLIVLTIYGAANLFVELGQREV